MWHKMTIKTKLLIAFLVVGLLPVLVVTGLSLSKASQALEEGSLDKLMPSRSARSATWNGTSSPWRPPSR
ncbi:MAG: hypothetical protein BWK76_17690 [Desulfobulbaceae bacterium A2]|nr:MAG: hypothetical protein BWK76_17690 [Desulfobulbaceae bacterium A2]